MRTHGVCVGVHTCRGERRRQTQDSEKDRNRSHVRSLDCLHLYTDISQNDFWKDVLVKLHFFPSGLFHVELPRPGLMLQIFLTFAAFGK